MLGTQATEVTNPSRRSQMLPSLENLPGFLLSSHPVVTPPLHILLKQLALHRSSENAYPSFIEHNTFHVIYCAYTELVFISPSPQGPASLSLSLCFSPPSPLPSL